MSPWEPNDDWCVLSAISVVYDMAGRSFVKQVTRDRFFGRSYLRRGCQERTGDFRVNKWSAEAGSEGQAMGQQLQPWQSGKAWQSGKPWRSGKPWPSARSRRSGDGERRWLSRLVDAMEEFSRPDVRRLPCHPSLLVAVRAQLARPVSLGARGASRFRR